MLKDVCSSTDSNVLKLTTTEQKPDRIDGEIAI